jgi:hypothetical protein
MWLLVVVFMIHDFEETILMMPWLASRKGLIQARFPKNAARLLPAYAGLTSAGFALAVAEEFVIVSAVTLAAVEFGWYAFWLGLLIGFFIHLLFHIATTLAVRMYVPVILTGIPASLYCVYALIVFSRNGLAPWPQTALWTVFFLLVLVANLKYAIQSGIKFDAWIKQIFPIELDDRL